MQFDLNKIEIITAMVTPLNQNREVNYEKLEFLVNYLMENGSDAILVAGTTGESPTLKFEEELEILSSAKRAGKNQIPIIMGAGSNCTKTAIKYVKLAEKEGADAILSVVPYYNKPSQEGMYQHFKAIAEAVNIPVIIYNIPSRTGVNMQPETVARLANDFKNIRAIKQSFADMDAVTEIKLACPEDFLIYCGDDSLTLPMLSLGAHGVVSVASHLFGRELRAMIGNFKSGKIKEALQLHLKLYPIFKKLFFAPNPVPVKAALAHRGLIKDYVKLPLVELTDNQKQEFFEVLDSIK